MRASERKQRRRPIAAASRLSSCWSLSPSLACSSALLLPAIQLVASRRSTHNVREQPAADRHCAYRLSHRASSFQWVASNGGRRRDDPAAACLVGVFAAVSRRGAAAYSRLDLDAAVRQPRRTRRRRRCCRCILCPSSPRTSPLVDGRGACDYGGIYGERITSPNNPPKGTMLIDAVVTVRHIRDGTSKTLIVAEDSRFGDRPVDQRAKHLRSGVCDQRRAAN